MTSRPTQLEHALSRIPLTPIEQLAVAHVTVGRWLSAIVASRTLNPRHCDVLNRKAVFFSYGAPYYRPHNHQTEDKLEFPIVFVFDVELLDQFSRFYPFDTGAMGTGAFGSSWQGRLGNLEDLHIARKPERLVACFYESNGQYLRGEVGHAPRGPAPIPTIHAFLSADLSASGVDQRQRTIECIADAPINVLAHLRLVAYPITMSSDVRRLWEACPKKFEPLSYEPDVNDNPAMLMTLLRKQIREKLEHYWKAP